jgi:hypothetical protein
MLSVLRKRESGGSDETMCCTRVGYAIARGSPQNFKEVAKK